MPNFRKLSKLYEKQAIIALQQFIRIDSTYDAQSVDEKKPYGKGVAKALAYFAKLGREMGFKIRDVDGHAVELSYGEEGPLIGVYGHADVVPVSGTWTYPPFSGTYKDGVIYGRGAIDDKGPLTAALYAAKLLKDNHLLSGYRLKIVAGGDEERGSSCLKYYFEKGNGEAPKFGFTPDADFPVVMAEKGNYNGTLVRVVNLDPIVAMDGGTVRNAVCSSLLVTLQKDKRLEKWAKEHQDIVEDLSNEVLTMLRFIGKPAHGSEPQKGKNAAAIAFKALGEFYQNKYLESLANILSSGHGEAFNGNFNSKVLGPNTFNFGVIKYDGRALKISLDFRYGEEAKPQESVKSLELVSKMTFVKDGSVKPLLYPANGPLIKTLLKAYRHQTHRYFEKPLAIGGGTYAKEAPNTVAFGACFDGKDGNMHGIDEFIETNELRKDIAIYAEAIYRLGKEAQK